MLYNWRSNLRIKITYEYAKYFAAVVWSAFVNFYAKKDIFSYSQLHFYERKLKVQVWAYK